MKRFLMSLVAGVGFVFVCLLTVSGSVNADTTEAGVYGGGAYGSCGYGTCTITLTSGGSTAVNVTPSGAGKCTVHSDTASVETDNAAGYVLTMTVDSTSNSMSGTSGTIPASSASASSPATLSMNSWGYRVDGVGGFGAGPTSSQDNSAVPSLAFAGVPPNTQPGTAVASSNSAANPAQNTTVWYGVCADTTQPAGAYAASVLYTAVAS